MGTAAHLKRWLWSGREPLYESNAVNARSRPSRQRCAPGIPTSRSASPCRTGRRSFASSSEKFARDTARNHFESIR